MNTTHSTKAEHIKRNWHEIDLKGKILGRAATEIAVLLMGKRKPNFVKNLDCGDHVVVINAKEVVTTGKKEKQKKYYRHSGYPGGFKEIALEKQRIEHPDRIIEHAVKGMLPDNKLKAGMMKRLHIFVEGEHTYADKFKKHTEEAQA